MPAKELKELHILRRRMQELPITAANNPFPMTHTDRTSSCTEGKAAASTQKKSLHNTELGCYKQRTKALFDPSL